MISRFTCRVLVVHLQHLSLTNFRNYRRFECGLPTGPLILVGRNAQGKTSLLEAIYYLAGASSPHASHDRQLIHWLAVRNDPLPYLKIVAEVLRDAEVRTVDVRIELEVTGSRKEARLKKSVIIDGVKKRVRDLSGVVNAVMFLPQDLALVEGPPTARRRYLDATICQVDPVYCAALSEYAKVLPQRNALLKQLQDRDGVGIGQLEFWDEQLCQSGAVLITRRSRAIEEIERYAVSTYDHLTEGVEHLRLDYRPSYDPIDKTSDQLSLALDVPVKRGRLTEAEISAGLRERLHTMRSDEILRGMTMVGPHRDELRFINSGVDLGMYGSRGQARSAVLALKLAEMAWMRDRSGEWPVLLLDEVLAELDPHRRGDLLARIHGADQVLLTTTDLNMLGAEFRQSSQVWAVTKGSVRSESSHPEDNHS